MHGWQTGHLTTRRVWAEALWSITLDTAIEPFEPGQWLNVGLELGGEVVKRAYSIASPPLAPLELYLVRVEGGALTPRLHALDVGDALLVQPRAQGFFTLRHVPDAAELWLISTGTGLGPFLSMLRAPTLWSRFERVVVVNGVRKVAHLGYEEDLLALARSRPGRLRYVPLVTREPAATSPQGTPIVEGRIPAAIADGRLEAAAAVELSPASAHVMLCGNPAMVVDAMAVLAERGLQRHRARQPGHVTIEKYW